MSSFGNNPTNIQSGAVRVQDTLKVLSFNPKYFTPQQVFAGKSYSATKSIAESHERLQNTMERLRSIHEVTIAQLNNGTLLPSSQGKQYDLIFSLLSLTAELYRWKILPQYLGKAEPNEVKSVYQKIYSVRRDLQNSRISIEPHLLVSLMRPLPRLLSDVSEELNDLVIYFNAYEEYDRLIKHYYSKFYEVINPLLTKANSDESTGNVIIELLHDEPCLVVLKYGNIKSSTRKFPIIGDHKLSALELQNTSDRLVGLNAILTYWDNRITAAFA